MTITLAKGKLLREYVESKALEKISYTSDNLININRHILRELWENNRILRRHFLDIAVDNYRKLWLKELSKNIKYGDCSIFDFIVVDIREYWKSKDIILALKIAPPYEDTNVEVLFNFFTNMFIEPIRDSFNKFFNNDFVFCEVFIDDFYNNYNMDNIYVDQTSSIYIIWEDSRWQINLPFY